MVTQPEKIAIIGMGALFPGSTTPEEFWANLVANKSMTGEAGAEDFGADPALFYNKEKGVLDTCYSLQGGFVRDFAFDPKGYKTDAVALVSLDRLYHWCLYVAREALRDSGYWNHPVLERCGVIMGNLSFPTRSSREALLPLYQSMAKQVLEKLSGESLPDFSDTKTTGITLKDDGLASSVVAKAIGLQGPHFTLDAACASSLYAVKLACDELLSGKADLMLAGAVSCADPLLIHIGFSYFHAYAQSSEQSTPLDQDSNGLISSEGAGMIVLKRLSDARRDGDEIRAVIEGIGLSNDGKGEFLLTPNPKGQRLAFERAYAQTVLQPSDIDYLECHATGTKLGDKVEINSISQFFNAENQKVPLIGSVKSNLGHLLTAAGMASIIKVVLAMQNRLIPATIGIHAPVESADGRVGKEAMVRENKTWNPKGNIPRAGINAFGFGGTNAHMILSAPDDQSSPEQPGQLLPNKNPEPMAVVGMDLHMGDCDGLEAYYLSLLLGRQHFRTLPAERWKGMDGLRDVWETTNLPPPESLRGAWIEQFDMDPLRYKIRPNEIERITHQQMLMLKVADRAMQDAGLKQAEGSGANVAVIIAMETELEIHQRLGRWHMDRYLRQISGQLDMEETEIDTLSTGLKNAVFSDYQGHSLSEHTGFIGNIMASRIASMMNFTGPSFTVSCGENSVYKALDIARTMLSNREVDAVVLGAVDLGGGMERTLSRHAANPVQTGPVSMGWNHTMHGWAIGEGAGAIVLKRITDTADDRIYCRIDDLAIVQQHPSKTADAVTSAASQVFNRQALTCTDIGSIEVTASVIPEKFQAEISGLKKIYRTDNKKFTCAVSSSKTHIGHTFAASGIASVIKTGLSLYHRFLPGTPHWEGPASSELLAQTLFYVPAASRPWIPEKGQKKLRAAISGLDADGTAAHVLLSEGTHPANGQLSAYLLKGGERLFPIRFTTFENGISRLTNLENEISGKNYTEISDKLCTDFVAEPDLRLRTLVIVAASNEELQREIRFFQTSLNTAPTVLQTPSGSYYTDKPLAPKGKIALVYPGSGSAYLNAGSHLLQAFPELYDRLMAQDYHPSEVMGEALYPRSLFALNKTQIQEKEIELQSNAVCMMATGCTFSGLYTSVLQDCLEVQADAVFGYSMGETSAMWYSQGIWDTQAVETKFLNDPLFSEQLGGRMTLLAKLWQMPEEESRKHWGLRLIRSSSGTRSKESLADWFRKTVLPFETRVFLTFINTDTEIVISGHSDDLNRIAEKFQLAMVTLPANNIVHHEFCRGAAQELKNMHRMPIRQNPDEVYYSGVTLQPLNIETETLADHALEVCCRPVDWPGIVGKMAADGHTIFIETGTNSTCSRWIQDILKTENHIAIPMDRKGQSTLRNLTGLVARLLSHGIPVNLGPFFKPVLPPEKAARTYTKTIRTGGPRFETLLLTNENKKIFSGKMNVLKPIIASTGETYLTGFPANNPEADIAHQKKKDVIWDEADLLTFATGRIQDVFGQEYALIDTYPRRVMLPKPPYLLVSRVTKLDAKLLEFKPSRITTEYDIPFQSAFTTDGQIPWAVAVESGQCDLLLISYLGIDFKNKGEYVYRLLDCTLTFLEDLPMEGQTLRYDIYIDRFVQNGNNLLFFFRYECFVETKMVLKMDGGCAGFFNDQELALGQGVVFNQKEIQERKDRPKQFFTPLLECSQSGFSREDLLALTKGDMVRCFHEGYHPNGRNTSLRLPPEPILMLDRITKVDRKGGSAGIGCIEAEKDLHPDDWYFPCHFRDDQVLAGSLQAEGGGQLLKFFMLLLGMQRLTKDARFEPIPDLPQKVRCRKEVPAREGKLIYQMEVKEIGLAPEPYVIADLAIIYEGQIAVFFENLGLRLREKNDVSANKKDVFRQNGVIVKPVGKPVLLNEYHITQFALGPVYKCFGEEYKIFEGRNLSRQPNTDLQLISRVLSVSQPRFVFNKKAEIITEYDVPENAWYYVQNAAPEMPYSILMEIALQPCGILGAYLGSTLGSPEIDLFFRNLDGDGNLLQSIDLRGKTITNRAILLSHTAFNGTVLQRYSFELRVDQEVFYKGNSSFGFFSKEDLSSQTGLDQGKHTLSWMESQETGQHSGLSFKLDSLFGKMKLYQPGGRASKFMHLAGDQLNLLDQATVLKDGGIYKKGYIFARKQVKPYDWFFTCHFYQDPVMPGSLGIEAIMQAIQIFALQQGLADHLPDVSFRQLAPHQTIWKYRGQILQADSEMSLEVHIKEIRKENDSVVLVADANLWKESIRIYEVKQIAVAIGRNRI